MISNKITEETKEISAFEMEEKKLEFPLLHQIHSPLSTMFQDHHEPFPLTFFPSFLYKSLENALFLTFFLDFEQKLDFS